MSTEQGSGVEEAARTDTPKEPSFHPPDRLLGAAPKTPEEIAAEMVPEPREDGKWRAHLVEPGDDGDWVPLEPQYVRSDADVLVADARGIIARLVERERSEGLRLTRREADVILMGSSLIRKSGDGNAILEKLSVFVANGERDASED